jgi:pimeloyl-ACP methyl ester carboxylesterase
MDRDSVSGRVALPVALATALSLEVLAVGQGAIKESPRARYGSGPAPYEAIEVAFENPADRVHLAGTLTVPHDAVQAPAVMLSQGLGSEPYDRDYAVPTAPTLKSFVAIADELSRHGIVVLRVDDRGAGGSSGRKEQSSVDQLADDIVVAVEFLKSRKEVNPNRIGIIGHSFAGLTVPIAAVRSSDVAFVIMLAGLTTDARVNFERLPPGFRTVTTATWNALAESSPALGARELESRLESVFIAALADVTEQQRGPIQGAMAAIIRQMVTWAPLYRSQAHTDPGKALRALKKPFLAIHGTRDRDLELGKNLLALAGFLNEAGNPDFTVAAVPDIDHWMWVCTQAAEPGKPCLEMRYSPAVLDLIKIWINKH